MSKFLNIIRTYTLMCVPTHLLLILQQINNTHAGLSEKHLNLGSGMPVTVLRESNEGPCPYIKS